ncbi:HAD family hydrolase [Candidatus Dependentiae bacterium]
MKYSAIIFDLDGTIVDSEPIWERATVCLLASKGITVDQTSEKKLRKELHGIGIIKSAEVLINFFNLKETSQELISEQNTLVKKFYEQEIKFIDGFLDFHKKLGAFNLKKGIATNADYHTLKISRTKFGLDKFFGNHIYCAEDVNNISKPEPDLYLHAAKKLEVEPAVCVAIEDSMFGIHAAKKAGMFCIGINTSGKRQSLQDADMIVNNYQEIELDAFFKKQNITG